MAATAAVLTLTTMVLTINGPAVSTVVYPHVTLQNCQTQARDVTSRKDGETTVDGNRYVYKSDGKVMWLIDAVCTPLRG